MAYDAAAPTLGPAGAADLVLTFRNVHNWYGNGRTEAMFKAFYDVLKPGGTLGFVEHRVVSEVTPDDRSGYMGQAQVTAMVQAAKYRMIGESDGMTLRFHKPGA